MERRQEGRRQAHQAMLRVNQAHRNIHKKINKKKTTNYKTALGI